MLELIFEMIWRMCMIVTIAFLITRLNLFRQMIFHRLSWKGKIGMIFVFGLFGMIGNYTGIIINPEIIDLPFKPYQQTVSFIAIADTRNIGVIIGGLIGGPAVGLGAGFIAGGHRFLLGGFISTSTFILTVIGGLIAGLIHLKIANKERIQPFLFFMVSVFILIIQIIMIPVFTESRQAAIQLVKHTGLPIIIVNGIGIWICSLIFYSVMRDFSTQLKLIEAERQRVLLQSAEIKALQAQIHPHFLFNSLNVIAALCKKEPLFARKLLINLSTFLRNNTSATRKNLIPIEKEMESVMAYCSLEQARFPDRFNLETTLSPGTEMALIPPFTIQPLIENAIVHGFSENCKKLTVEITIAEENGSLIIWICDNGAGISKERLELLDSKTIFSTKGSGIAIQNIKERLSLIFGSKAVFSIKSQINKGTVIKIVVPLHYERKEMRYDKSIFG